MEEGRVLGRTTENALLMKPYIDYYRAHNISPVVQDVSDLNRHFERRSSLYRSLRIPPRYVHGRSVLEFGPGSGHNALYTEYLGPQRYLLVDANPRGIEETGALLRKMYPDERNYEIVHSLIEEFDSPERFDLVLAENLIAFRLDPATFTRRIARSVAEDGILVITCADAPSIMGEIGRRLIACRLVDASETQSERIDRLASTFAPHLKTLNGMSRSVKDWIYDDILFPFIGETFAIDDAITALEDQFDVLGSSPEFTTDMRWYKQLYGEQRNFNQNVAAAYLENMLNFLDYRITVPPHSTELGKAIRDVCRRIYRTMQQVEAGADAKPVDAVSDIRGLAALVESSPRTSLAFRELADVLEARSVDDPNQQLREFVSYFGRGTQYLSFVRRGSSLAAG